jgi:hypothetical protein
MYKAPPTVRKSDLKKGYGTELSSLQTNKQTPFASSSKTFQFILIPFFNKNCLIKQRCENQFVKPQQKCLVEYRWWSTYEYIDLLYRPGSVVTVPGRCDVTDVTWSRNMCVILWMCVLLRKSPYSDRLKLQRRKISVATVLTTFWIIPTVLRKI